ncbi:hypothetical protein [Novilysobacter selenitireducens]|uniref:SMODS and SLOG-associating 2TM effector domain-containing protein n=1 Tax=Novilysobacter selenitireducens TaxID=2872639 RepID=A0ABS7T2H1_9GAMM|nr:hypothetical protein [Lysobacter selenitireducens]MBZ4038075.1 hypothetical protein [Lysobacter selenitireducens]
MNKELLLKVIAESGYNVGYSAKKHLATFAIVEKAPGWISIFSFAVGVFALVIKQPRQQGACGLHARRRLCPLLLPLVS